MAYRNEIHVMTGASSVGLSAGAIAASVVAAAGSLPDAWKFVMSGTLSAATRTEKLRAGTTKTWEDMGVEAGSTINSVQLLGWNYTVSGVSGLAVTQTMKLRLVDPSGTSVIASDLFSGSVPASATARAPGATSAAINVLSTAQNSASQIALEAESAIVLTTLGLTAITTQIDTVLLKINYTPPAVVVIPPTPMISLGD